VIVTPQPVPQCKALKQATGFTEQMCSGFHGYKNKSGLEIFWKESQAFLSFDCQ